MADDPRAACGLGRVAGMFAAVALACALVAAPASAETDPSSTTSTTSPDASTTTTTEPVDTTTSSRPTDGERADPAPSVDDQPGPDAAPAGPPLLAASGVRMPSDSLDAALAELSLVRARLDLVTRRLPEVQHRIEQLTRDRAEMRDRRSAEEQRRVDRAVAIYRGHIEGRELTVLTEGRLVDERSVYLVAAADAAARKRVESLAGKITAATRDLRELRTEAAALEEEAAGLTASLTRLSAKLAAATGTIGAVGVPDGVPSASSAIALLADGAAAALAEALVAGRPPVTDARWLAARHALAVELAGTSSGARRSDAAAIERDWDAARPEHLRVVLFALRQVGKPYVYATAGPETFDCSGLTKRAYAEVGLGLPHFSGAQLGLGIPVRAEALVPADLLAYGPAGADHIAMYVGGGVAVEARGAASGVVVSAARVGGERFAGATRILP